ncbi:hypothetical protein [Haliscomenobacter sp.]|uniref:hypothetical protein n=1 Tax=Haliscomenobacter sp. TaxID=2717303 RepID=UPI003594802D
MKRKIKTIENPIEEKDIHDLSFEELFEVLRLKNKVFSIKEITSVLNVLKLRDDLLEEEQEILSGLLPNLNLQPFIHNPEFKLIGDRINYNMSKALLEGDNDLMEFIFENMDKPEFTEYVKQKDEELSSISLLGGLKFSDLVKIVKEDSVNPIVQQARQNVKFKKAVQVAKHSHFSTLKTDFYLRRFKTISPDFIQNEFDLTNLILKGESKSNHLLDLLNIKSEDELQVFNKLSNALSKGIEPNYKENYVMLCKLFGFELYRSWVSKFIKTESRINIEEIDSFSKVITNESENYSGKLKNGRVELTEDEVQIALEKILDVPFHKKDWGGEINDLYTSNLKINGTRIPTAFLLKGNGTKSNELQIGDCGKNGDQILRLVDSPAQLFVIQYIGNISDNVIRDIANKVENFRLRGNLTWYCIIDGRDTYRILKAYGKI